MNNSAYLQTKFEWVTFTLTSHVNYTALSMCNIVKWLISAVASWVIPLYEWHTVYQCWHTWLLKLPHFFPVLTIKATAVVSQNVSLCRNELSSLDSFFFFSISAGVALSFVSARHEQISQMHDVISGRSYSNFQQTLEAVSGSNKSLNTGDNPTCFGKSRWWWKWGWQLKGNFYLDKGCRNLQ